MKWKKLTKKGSYLIEAVIIVPIFIIAVLALISLIPISGTCENMIFTAVDEMRMESLKTAFRKNPVFLAPLLSHRVAMENSKITSYQGSVSPYLYEDHQIEDLFSLQFQAIFQQSNPIALFNAVEFGGKITARAFTGKVHKTAPVSSVKEDGAKVYIFPEWGMKYHRKECSYVRANCQMVYLSQKIKGIYRPCHLCSASSAQIGSPVFCFSQNGEVYHLAECRTVERYYIEMDKTKAIERGYQPCTKCGGS